MIKQKDIVILAVLGFSFLSFIPPAKKIRLGLDLQGGTHLVYRVETEQALNHVVAQDAAEIAQRLTDSNIDFESCGQGERNTIEVRGIYTSQQHKAHSILQDTADGNYDTRVYTEENRVHYTFVLSDAAAQKHRTATVASTVEILRRRVDALGLKDPLIQPYGNMQAAILMELPGMDRSEAEGLIRPAKLELRFVKPENGGPFASREEALKANSDDLDTWKTLPSVQ